MECCSTSSVTRFSAVSKGWILQRDPPRTIIANMTDGLHLRPLNDTDPEVIAATFSSIGWNKPAALFQRYVAEQASGTRSRWVANPNEAFAGYVTVKWEPTHPFFAEQRIQKSRFERPSILPRKGNWHRIAGTC